MKPRNIDRHPPELVVYDQLDECPYLPGRKARMPLRLPIMTLSPNEVDARLSEGDRRHGALLYRPTCPDCTACEAIRINVNTFKFRASHRRILRKGDRALTISLGEPIADAERLALYEKHKAMRGLRKSDTKPLGLRGYQGFLVERCVPSFEIRYRHEERLVGIAITDHGEDALSAVYCHWDPEFAHLSIGTYSILKQIEICRESEMTYLYLGLYVEENQHMRYKGSFLPHERLIDGQWKRFENA